MKNKKRMEFIGNRISSLRIEKGITQEELAELSKVNLRTIQRIEKNETTPRNSTLELICNALETSKSEVSFLEKSSNDNKIITSIIHYFFLILLGFATMGVFGFLTMDTSANFNSKLGALIISFLLPFTIVLLTKTMASSERFLKFGFSYVIHFVLTFFSLGLGKAWVVGIYSFLFPCILISIIIIFYGDRLLPKD